MDMEHLINRPIAHRALHDETKPENTLAAIQAAIDKGYAIEGDLRLTNEGKLLWFHDGSLRRLTNWEVNIKTEELTEIKRKRIKLAGTDQHIPTLEEVLELVDGRVPLLIEIRTRGWYGLAFSTSEEARRTFELLSQALKKYRDKGPAYVQSFCPEMLQYKSFDEVGKMTKVGLLIPAFSVATVPLYTKLVKRDYDFYAVEKRGLTNKMVANLRQRGDNKIVLAWTIRNYNEESIILNEAKVDNIIFENYEPNINISKGK